MRQTAGLMRIGEEEEGDDDDDGVGDDDDGVEDGDVVTGRLEVASTGVVEPVLGVDTKTDVHAVSPAFCNVVNAPDPVAAVRADETLDAALLVVVTVNATLTEDCSRWRPEGAVTDVMATELDETPSAVATADLNCVA
jgi:hypothetical protein